MPFDALKYSLYLADNALILGHRNSEWTGHGPILEQDIALSNVALDLIGQARNFYQYAALLSGRSISEDDLAYLRDPREFLNCLLVEQENGHWGKTILRQFFYSSYAKQVYGQLARFENAQIAAIAEKSLKETLYHLRWSSEWVIRLGNGTEESHSKMQDALDELWSYTEELYTPEEYEPPVDHEQIRKEWQNNVFDVLQKAHLSPRTTNKMHGGGKAGDHTEHLGKLLEEMQYMQRTYPGMEW
jgi:ring-1,2-phenylacetyl-CoA epoxidase subunit PaaC